MVAVAAIIAMLAMAKRRGSRRNFSRYLKGAIALNFALGTLAGRAVLGTTTLDKVVDTMRVSSVRATYAINNFTNAAGVGPIIVGMSHSDYTDGEIEEWLETTESWDIGDKIAREKRARLIRQVGIFDEASAASGSGRLNDGKPITTKLGWVLSEGDTVKFWAYNSGNGAIATTDPTVIVTGHANLWAM